MAETISALLRRMPSTHPIPFSASHWGAPHEIHISERQDALPTILVCCAAGQSGRAIYAKSTPSSPTAILLATPITAEGPSWLSNIIHIVQLSRVSAPAVI